MMPKLSTLKFKLLSKRTQDNFQRRAACVGPLIFLAIVFCRPVFSANISAVAQDEQWLKLLRYNKTIFGHKSEVDNKEFFLAPNGKKSPEKELVANLAGFNKDISRYEDPNEHPICRFPGRYLFLEKKGLVDGNFDFQLCPEYWQFKNKLELHSISIIFSSYYIDKPASAFGHTLLKLNKEEPLKGDLQAYGVDFSAQVTTKNPLMYGVLGITGGFYGRFSLLPYFLKMREYNDYESRDLWEFELNLSPDELELAAAHLWDMNMALFDYYYFTENCSYHILRFVDAIRPEWGLWDETYSFMIPVDTLIPLVEKTDVLKGIYLRPSLRQRTFSQIDNLNETQRERLELSIKASQAKLEGLGEKERVQVLDAMIDYLDLKYPSEFHLNKKNDKITNFKRELLVERSLAGVSSKQVNKRKQPGFDYSHPARKWSVGYRNSNDSKVGSGYELRHRFALHNISEASGEIYSDFSLEMGKLALLYRQDDDRLLFEQFEVAHVEALRPMSSLEKQISWNFAFGVEREALDADRGGAYLDVGVGASYRWKSNIFALFAQSENSQLFKAGNPSKIGLAGFNAQWLFKREAFSFKANYKSYADFYRGGDAVQLWGAKASYQFGGTAAVSLEQERTFHDERGVVSVDFYY